MTIFQLLAAISAFLLASYTAYRIGTDKPIAHINFGNQPVEFKSFQDYLYNVREINLMAQNMFEKWKKESALDINIELERSKLLVLQKDAQRRKKQREAVKARKRVKGKFA